MKSSLAILLSLCAFTFLFCFTLLISSLERKYAAKKSLSSVTLYIVTATYKRLVQKAELTRLCNTFKNVRNIHWIVVEDSSERQKLVVSQMLLFIPFLFTRPAAKGLHVQRGSVTHRDK
ncbi:unnamed protein product [Echinostoma caproni]|uniref:galactosylgalactosylxylosylprotein 3-beta-glucuronosyltransferase n=1 Tax=Echinostoma caproni TaxID=27848 RepID=A0A183BG95_9TREM|nr:unnamed protein product [Echinostoma caproni]